MSAENVEAVRRSWEAWDRRDMEALFRFYDPEVEWDQTAYPTLDLSRVYHGHEGVREFFRLWLSPFEDYWTRFEEPIDAGDAVVVRVTQGGRGKGSGVEIEMPPLHQVYRMRDGLCVRVEVYEHEADARAAAGLEAT